MELEKKDIYEKPIYKINVVDCFNEIVTRINQELPEGEIKNHSIWMFNEALKGFQESIGINPRMKNNVKFKTLHEIETTHPAFYTWLAYFLTIQNPIKIPLILESYRNGRFGAVQNFNNSIEYRLLTLLKHVPFDHDKQDQAILQWVLKNNNFSDITSFKKETNSEETLNCFQDEKITPRININYEWQNELKLLFSEYFNSNVDRNIYNHVMQGRHVKKGFEISLNLKANVFCNAIRELHKRGGIINSKKNKIAIWIITNFKFDVQGDIREIKKNYCIQLLSGKDIPNTRDQLPLPD